MDLTRLEKIVGAFMSLFPGLLDFIRSFKDKPLV
jgi:hypothetical protein